MKKVLTVLSVFLLLFCVVSCDDVHGLLWTSVVSFDTKGICPAPQAQMASSEGKISKPQDPVDSNGIYIFENWYKDFACTSVVDFEKDTFEENTTLYANWVLPEGKLVFYYPYVTGLEMVSANRVVDNQTGTFVENWVTGDPKTYGVDFSEFEIKVEEIKSEERTIKYIDKYGKEQEKKVEVDTVVEKIYEFESAEFDDNDEDVSWYSGNPDNLGVLKIKIKYTDPNTKESDTLTLTVNNFSMIGIKEKIDSSVFYMTIDNN